MNLHKSHVLAAELEAEDCLPEVRNAAAAELRRLHEILLKSVAATRKHKQRVRDLMTKFYAGLNDDQIVKLAREAGEYQGDHVMTPLALHRFRVLVVAAEREACAQVCDGLLIPSIESNDPYRAWIEATLDCAAAIRARSQA